MTTHISDDPATEAGSARSLSQGRKPGLHSAQVVRKLAALPLSLYLWMSGTPATEQERLRAAVVEATNSQAHRRIFL